MALGKDQGMADEDDNRVVRLSRMEAFSAWVFAIASLYWCWSSYDRAGGRRLMMEHYLRHLLVEDRNGRGMVSAHDLLGAYAS
jgi:hypothetical protein